MSLSMLSRTVVGLFVIAVLGSCSGYLPGSAVPWQVAARQYYPLSDSAPIIAVERQRNLEPPDASRSMPMLEQLADQLAKSDPDGLFKGVTYESLNDPEFMRIAGKKIPSLEVFHEEYEAARSQQGLLEI